MTPCLPLPLSASVSLLSLSVARCLSLGCSLQSNTEYVFRVAAKNDGGVSFSAPLRVRLPLSLLCFLRSLHRMCQPRGVVRGSSCAFATHSPRIRHAGSLIRDIILHCALSGIIFCGTEARRSTQVYTEEGSWGKGLTDGELSKLRELCNVCEDATCFEKLAGCCLFSSPSAVVCLVLIIIGVRFGDDGW